MRVPCCFVVALISALALAQNLSGLPACAQTCVSNVFALAPSLGCAATDYKCLCMNVNFGYGIRDCSVETCATPQDAQTAITFATEFCASILAPVGPAPTSSFGQPSSTTATALQAITQAPSGSSTALIPTTLITTSDSAGNNFTVTGEILVSGTSSTTVPCRTVITTNTAGVTVTSTETGLSVLPTELQKENTSFHALTPSATASSSLIASPSITTLTAGAEMPNSSNSVILSVGLSSISIIILVLL